METPVPESETMVFFYGCCCILKTGIGQPKKLLLWQTQPTGKTLGWKISSGYSFRGLDWCFQHPVHFIDTDLPDLVTAKARLVQSLITGNPAIMKGVYELLPLNVMDEAAAFMDVLLSISFRRDRITIINVRAAGVPGQGRKRTACAGFHPRTVLLQRGGYWGNRGHFI